jgi:UDP-3-O-[3-hydroxymyristoyl] glucosamine N-acyltransferase
MGEPKLKIAIFVPIILPILYPTKLDGHSLSTLVQNPFMSLDNLRSTSNFWPLVDVSQAAFIAPNATVMGDISLAVGVSVWYGAVLRADVERIEIGAYTNIQDGAILHEESGQNYYP